jgi:hypothetical protein
MWWFFFGNRVKCLRHKSKMKSKYRSLMFRYYSTNYIGKNFSGIGSNRVAILTYRSYYGPKIFERISIYGRGRGF